MKSPLVPRPLHDPRIWSLAWLVWFAVLWSFSSGPVDLKDGPEIPHIDKVYHAGYFFGGAGLLSAALWLRSEISLTLPHLLLITAPVFAAVGALDEWHQSWIPERTGNDPYDFLADLTGAILGTLVFHKLRHKSFGEADTPNF